MAGDLPLRGELRAMLRITMHDSPESVTFLVEGKLVGDWAKELEQCCKQTASVRGHRALIIDLSNVPYVDSAGVGALVGAYVTRQNGGRSLALELPLRIHPGESRLA